MIYITRILWIFSCLFFLALNAFCYLKISNNLEILNYTLSKKSLFYLGTGLFVFFNFLIILTNSILTLIPKRYLIVPKKNSWLSQQDFQKQLYRLLVIFFSGLAFLSNVFFTLALAWFLFDYIKWEQDLLSNTSILLTVLFYITNFLTILWILYHAIIFFFPKSIQE